VQMVYRTLQRSFEHVQVFVLANGNSIVLATEKPLAISMAMLEERGRNQETSLELSRAGISFPVQLLSLLALNSEEAATFAGQGAIHTYDNGALEFAAQSDYLFSVRRPENS